MGLIKAAMGAAGGVLADQWKEFFLLRQHARQHSYDEGAEADQFP